MTLTDRVNAVYGDTFTHGPYAPEHVFYAGSWRQVDERRTVFTNRRTF